MINSSTDTLHAFPAIDVRALWSPVARHFAKKTNVSAQKLISAYGDRKQVAPSRTIDLSPLLVSTQAFDEAVWATVKTVVDGNGDVDSLRQSIEGYAEPIANISACVAELPPRAFAKSMELLASALAYTGVTRKLFAACQWSVVSDRKLVADATNAIAVYISKKCPDLDAEQEIALKGVKFFYGQLGARSGIEVVKEKLAYN